MADAPSARDRCCPLGGARTMGAKRPLTAERGWGDTVGMQQAAGLPGARARELLGRGVKTAAEMADRVVRAPRGVVVLLYHRVGARSGLNVDLPTALFEEQIAALAATGRVVTLDRALDALAHDAPPEGDPIVVTFDDGTADFVDDALPVLERHQVPALLYVATDFVESRRAFPDNGTPVS